jgi:delta 1-pyrroline-5-carboxylate dehydrogenase
LRIKVAPVLCSVVAKVLGEALNSLGQRCSAQRRFMAALPFYSAAFWAMQGAASSGQCCAGYHDGAVRRPL